MEILFPLLLAYTNGVRAVRKGHSMWLWVVVTFIAYMLATGVGGMLLMAAFYKGDLTEYDPQAVSDFLEQNTIRPITVLVAGIGGYLAVRYTIDRRLIPRGGGHDFPE